LVVAVRLQLAVLVLCLVQYQLLEAVLVLVLPIMVLRVALAVVEVYLAVAHLILAVKVLLVKAMLEVLIFHNQVLARVVVEVVLGLLV
jgi:hypothetical protein